MAWASAWSSRNMSAYYGAYTPEFAPSGSSHKEWEEDRKARIVGKSRISVKLSGVSVKVDGSTAVARFRQEYSADALQANTHKTLTLVKRGSRWLISKEVSG